MEGCLKRLVGFSFYEFERMYGLLVRASEFSAGEVASLLCSVVLPDLSAAKFLFRRKFKPIAYRFAICVCQLSLKN